MEGIRHIFIAARLQYGHKNKPIEIISSGLDIHLTLRLCIATRCLTVAKIGSIFETAKLLIYFLSKKLRDERYAVFQTLF